MKKTKNKEPKIQYTNLKLKLYVSKKELSNFNPLNFKINDPEIKVLFTKDDKDPNNIFTFELVNIKENVDYNNLSFTSKDLLNSLDLSHLFVSKNDNRIVVNTNLKTNKSGFKKDSTRILELGEILNENEKLIDGVEKDIDLVESDKYKINDDLFIFPEEYLNMFLEKIDEENNEFKTKFKEIYEDRNKMISDTLSEIDSHTTETKLHIKDQIKIEKSKKDKFTKEKLKQINIFMEKVDKENDDFKKIFNDIYEARNQIIEKAITEADSHIKATKEKIQEQVKISKEKFEEEKLKQKEEIESKTKKVQNDTKIFKERLDKYIEIVKEENEKRKKYTKSLSDKEIQDLKDKLEKTKKEIQDKINEEENKLGDKSEEPSSEIIINKKENIDYKNKYEKLLDSTSKEKEEIIKYKSVDFIKEILPGLDMLTSSINSDGISEEAKKWFVGFEMIVADFKKVLQMEGVEEIPVKKGDKFNSQYHLAIEEVVTDEVEPGEIVKVNLVGYLIKGRMLRPATVTIAKKKGKK